MQKFSEELKNEKIQLRISGSRDNLSPSLLQKLDDAVNMCAEGEFILNICFNYGSKEEILRACRKIAQSGAENIDEAMFQSYLWNGDLPPVDLLIRTSGEYRISNFMLWQCAYAEFYFSPKLWPDFNIEDLKLAVAEYDTRQRRYGK